MTFVKCEHCDVQPIVIIFKCLLSTGIHSLYLNTMKMQSDSLKSEKVGGEVKVAHISLIAVSLLEQLELQRAEGRKAERVCEACERRALVINVLPAVIG